MATFGQRLRAAMERQGVTVRELAKRMDVHEKTIYRWREDPRGPSIADCDKIARALGVPITDLVQTPGVGEPVAGTANAVATARPPGVSVGMADRPLWREQWTRVLTALAILHAAYEPEARVLNNVEVDLRVRSFFTECHHLGDWIREDLDNLPRVGDAHAGAHVETSLVLSACDAICNKAKHAERSKDPRTKEDRSTGRVLTVDRQPSGSYSVSIRVDWTPKSEWASTSPSCFDALKLADDCVTSWREFFRGVQDPRTLTAAAQPVPH